MSDSGISNNWSLENINTFNLDPDLVSMLGAMFKAPAIHQPSKFWIMYVQKTYNNSTKKELIISKTRSIKITSTGLAGI
ncbi:MAG: hypothetical protein ACP5MG_08425 [Verrucomicrobiia bacterium]